MSEENGDSGKRWSRHSRAWAALEGILQHASVPGTQLDPLCEWITCQLVSWMNAELQKRGVGRSDIDDARQEVLLLLLAKIRQHKVHHLCSPAAFMAYLLRIVQHVARQVRRSRRYVPLFDQPHDSFNSQPTMVLDMAACLAQLPPVWVEAMTLVDVEGFSYKDAADELGRTPAAVKAMLAKGRKRMRELLSRAKQRKARVSDVRRSLPPRAAVNQIRQRRGRAIRPKLKNNASKKN